MIGQNQECSRPTPEHMVKNTGLGHDGVKKAESSAVHFVVEAEEPSTGQ